MPLRWIFIRIDDIRESEKVFGEQWGGILAKPDVDNVGAGRAAKGASTGRSANLAIPSLRSLLPQPQNKSFLNQQERLVFLSQNVNKHGIINQGKYLY